jgi:predicted PurR-regulated permease PerM
MAEGGLTRMERSVLLIALLFFILIAVKTTGYIVSLFFLAIVITMLAIPAQVWLRARGLSVFVSTLVIALVACLVVAALITLTLMSFNSVLANLPQFQHELNMRLTEITALLTRFGLEGAMNRPPTIDLKDLFSMGVSGATVAAETLMFLFFVGVTSFFMLLEIPAITGRLETRYGKDSDAMQNVTKMVGYVIDFIVVRTETNFIHGVLFGSFLGLIGVQGAILWGTLTFLLGYIPFFGLVIAAIPAIFFAWLQFGIPGALAVIVAVCILNLIIENPVYSYLAARKFEMPALIVILSVIFWGWLLGLIGMLLSIPFTLIILLFIQLSDELRWINKMIGVGHLFEDRNRKEEQG